MRCKARGLGTDGWCKGGAAFMEQQGRPRSSASSTTSTAKDLEIAYLQSQIAELRSASAGGSQRGYTSASWRSGDSNNNPGSRLDTPMTRQHHVKNGYGILTSQLSVSQIGAVQHLSKERREKNELARQQYDAAALRQTKRGKTRRYANSVTCAGTALKATTLVPNDKLFSHRYEQTQRRLQRMDAARLPTPPELKRFDFDPPPLYIEFQRDVAPHLPGRPSTQMTKQTVEEQQWNARKRNWNQAKFFTSEVKQTVQGEFEPPVRPLMLPVGASHQQVLGIDNKLVGENPLQAAPELQPPPDKWMGGDQIGWTGKIGMLPADCKARTMESLRCVNREGPQFDMSMDYGGRRLLGFDQPKKHSRN